MSRLNRRVPVVLVPALLILFVLSGVSAVEVHDHFEELRLPTEIGLDFPLPWDGGVSFAELPEDIAHQWFFQHFHGSRMYAVGRFDLYGSTVYITYHVDTSTPGVDARYELYIYSGGMELLDQMVLAHRESKPDWIDGRTAGIERTLSAELGWQQGEVHVMQWDLRAITYYDECGEEGCPDPTVTMETPGAVLTMEGSIRTR
jgi:hypothetical protein